MIEREGKRTIKMLGKCRTCILRQKSQISLLWDSNSRPLDDGRRGKSPTLSLLFGARCSGEVSNSQTFNCMFLKLERLRVPIYSGQCSEVMVHSLFGRWLFLRP